MRTLLGAQRLLLLSPAEFAAAVDGADRTLDTWKSEFEHFREEMRDLKNYRVSKADFGVKVRWCGCGCGGWGDGGCCGVL